MVMIGITERGDAGLDQSWQEKLSRVNGAILITKAPQLLSNFYIPSKCIIHCTITGFGGTVLEPNVIKPDLAIQAYYKILNEIGPERTVLRIDPIIPTEKGLATAEKIFRLARGRVRISFIDVYPHIRKRFNAAGLPELNPGLGKHYSLAIRKEALKRFPDAEICGEPGLACTGCISKRDLLALNINTDFAVGKSSQRQACACIAGKTELLTNKKPCAHGCLYCYWQ